MSPILTTGAGIVPVVSGGGGSAWLLDQITPQPTIAYSTRKLKSTATLALRLTDIHGDVFGDCGFDGSSDLDQTTVNTFYTVNDNCANCAGFYDQSGNGRDLIGATGSAALRYSNVESGALQTINSHPAVKFDGNVARDRIGPSTTLHLSDVWSASAFTAISVIYPMLIEPPSSEEIGLFCDVGLGYAGVFATYTKSTVDSVTVYVYDGADQIVSKPVSVNTAYIVVARLSGGTLSLWVNGGTPATRSCGNIGDMNYAFIRMTGPSTSAEVRMLELLSYNTALSNSEINTLMSASGVTNGNIASRAGVTWTSI